MASKQMDGGRMSMRSHAIDRQLAATVNTHAKLIIRQREHRDMHYPFSWVKDVNAA